jgi:hypothetical protein
VIEKPIEKKARPEKVTLLPVKWYVVSEENLGEFVATFRDRYNGAVFVALDVRFYENLSYNMTELERFILDQNALLDYYEEQVDAIFQTEQTSK